jgi:thymidine phosphorylase
LQISTANKLGLKTKAVLTAMDVPIGNTVGNALEIAESIDCLRGKGPDDLRALVLALSNNPQNINFTAEISN